jgi:hypothetical protein
VQVGEKVIRVNNRDEIAWEEGLTVSVLLERFRYTFPHIIVKIEQCTTSTNRGRQFGSGRSLPIGTLCGILGAVES